MPAYAFNATAWAFRRTCTKGQELQLSCWYAHCFSAALDTNRYLMPVHHRGDSMVKRKGAIVLVTEITPQSQLFMDYLREELGIPVEMAAPDGDWSAPDGERVLVLIDVDHADDPLIQQWQCRITDASQASLAAFNLDDEDQAADMLSTIRLQGIFYRN